MSSIPVTEKSQLRGFHDPVGEREAAPVAYQQVIQVHPQIFAHQEERRLTARLWSRTRFSD
jgi:hypothetical protein